MDELQKQSLDCINRIYGTKNLKTIAVEECSELIQALTKLQRLEEGDTSVRGSANNLLLNLDEEMADVLICIERLFITYNNRDRVDFIINKKINRTLESIRNTIESANKSRDNVRSHEEGNKE